MSKKVRDISQILDTMAIVGEVIITGDIKTEDIIIIIIIICEQSNKKNKSINKKKKKKVKQYHRLHPYPIHYPHKVHSLPRYHRQIPNRLVFFNFLKKHHPSFLFLFIIPRSLIYLDHNSNNPYQYRFSSNY